MAKMIPSIFPEDTPVSERKIFRRLELDPDTADWSVLHSLGLRRTARGPYGEIDFVVLIPGKGIVCLEVKGGEVSCRDGIWHTLNRKTGEAHTYKRSPFMQVRSAMFALKEEINKHFGNSEVAGCPISSAVVFPDVEAPPHSTEAEDWEVIDLHKLRNPISRAVDSNIRGTRKKLAGGKALPSVSNETLSKIRNFLRPDFERIVHRSATINASEVQLLALTEEQYHYLDIAQTNDRSLVTGAAGTGKTLLAMELARREAAAGKNVGLICFNRLLGNWLADAMDSDCRPNLKTGTFFAMSRDVIVSSTFASEFEEKCRTASSAEVFTEIYPFYAELALAELEAEFDTLIVDEAQDLLTANNLATLNALVKGGLAGGRWAFFGDFNRQAIYSESKELKSESAFEDLLSAHVSSFVKIPLSLNCRNTRQIGEETALMSGFDALPYRLGVVDGLSVDYRYWKNSKQEAQQLETVLEKLEAEGVDQCDIVILSATRFDKSAITHLSESTRKNIHEIDLKAGVSRKCISFSTIHAFKGMESPAVILTGITDLRTDEQRALLYVGMSRARSHLVVLAHDRVKSYLPELMAIKLGKGWRP